MLVNFTRGLAPSLIAPLEINRAQTELQNLRQAQQLAIRDWRVASAQLAEILLLDPSTLLEPIEPPYSAGHAPAVRTNPRGAGPNRPESSPGDRLTARAGGRG